jgi:hypothetical protein
MAIMMRNNEREIEGAMIEVIQEHLKEMAPGLHGIFQCARVDPECVSATRMVRSEFSTVGDILKGSPIPLPIRQCDNWRRVRRWFQVL